MRRSIDCLKSYDHDLRPLLKGVHYSGYSSVGEKTYILTPNEGDARDYKAYSEESGIGDIADQIQLKAENYEGYTQNELDQLVADGLLDELKKTNITLESGKNKVFIEILSNRMCLMTTTLEKIH